MWPGRIRLSKSAWPLKSSSPKTRLLGSAFCFLPLASFGLIAVATAHHSDAALDMNRVVSIDGSVVEFSWSNPHVYFTVAGKDESGELSEWSVQMPSTITMSRRGWNPDSLSAGDRVTVGVHPARDGRHYGLFQSLEKPDDADASISFDRASGELRFESAEAVERSNSLQGRWLADNAKLSGFPGGLDNLTRTLLRLTAKGAAAMAAYDENSDSNPELQCLARPTPAMLIYTNIYPIEIEFNDDQETISIRGQFFDEQRTVYMEGRPHPARDVRFHEGHSIGHWEDDTLVIDTRNFTDHRSPYQNGIPSGADKHVVERYRLIENGTRLLVDFLLEDAEYIAEPMQHSRELIYSPQIPMTAFNCKLDVTRRFIPVRQ
jgi:hypothetical protein